MTINVTVQKNLEHAEVGQGTFEKVWIHLSAGSEKFCSALCGPYFSSPFLIPAESPANSFDWLEAGQQVHPDFFFH